MLKYSYRVVEGPEATEVWISEKGRTDAIVMSHEKTREEALRVAEKNAEAILNLLKTIKS